MRLKTETLQIVLDNMGLQVGLNVTHTLYRFESISLHTPSV